MMMTRKIAFYIALAVMTATGCQHKEAAPTSTPPAVDAGEPARLRVTNHCEIDIWIAQQNFPGPALVHLQKGASTDYDIPAAGLASTRFWPKMLCDATGNNCAIGQSSQPCPAAGCAPPADSKLEATWGCTLADKEKCAKTPQGVRMIDTFWNASAVDGFTLPFTIAVHGGDGRGSCVPVDCAALTGTTCPVNENLSDYGKNPQYKNQIMRVVNPATKQTAGCFSTCSKLTYPTWGGDGAGAPGGAVAKMYCCPGPMSAECRSGPVVKTKYVAAVHAACKNTTYAYAYDDGIGLRTCSGDTVIEFVVGPGCASPAMRGEVR